MTTLDLSASPARVGGEVRDLRADERLGGKGIKYVMRGTRLLTVAVQQALQDAGLEAARRRGPRPGSSSAPRTATSRRRPTTRRRYLTSDPTDLLPMEGFDAALNSATNFAAVRFKLQACVSTVSSGFASSADALGIAAGLIRSGQATRVVAGGMEQLSLDAFLLAAEEGRLARGEGGGAERALRPAAAGFRARRGLLSLRPRGRDAARARGARIRGAVAGYGSLFTGGRRAADAVKP